MISKKILVIFSLLSLEAGILSAREDYLNRFKGRDQVAVVTGASAGIGLAVTVALLKKGIDVVAVARRETLQENIINELLGENAQSLGTLYARNCDVTNEEEFLKLFQWINAEGKGISIMVNNAGRPIRASLLGGETQSWEDLLKLNVIAVSVGTREAYKSMIENKIDGHIIQMSSVQGYSFINAYAHKMYNASKKAITVLADGLRHELQLTKSNIKVTSINPGLTNTEILVADEATRSYPIYSTPKPVLEAKNVADAVITALDTPKDVLIAELTIVKPPTPIQYHASPPPPYTVN